jgi:hypothetical protein
MIEQSGKSFSVDIFPMVFILSISVIDTVIHVSSGMGTGRDIARYNGKTDNITLLWNFYREDLMIESPYTLFSYRE